MTTREQKLEAFGRLLDIMDDLREKCPWDKKQTMESLRMLTLEEVYELSDAILENDKQHIKEEIGDLLLHMVFYAKIGSETNNFDIAQTLNSVCDKLISRHPHIYGDVKFTTEDEVKKNWEQLKLAEGNKSVLSGVPTSMPSIIKAYRMQDKTAQVGFQWDNISDVWSKVKEEIDELQEAIQSQSINDIEGEFGDVLFSLINYARYLNINPDTALERVNLKFKRRFEYIEANATKTLNLMTLDEMDLLWDQAKSIGL